MKLQIIRLQSDDKQTLGQGYVFDGLEKVYEFKTLELPWKDNQRDISCIRKGTYKVEKRISPTHGWCFHLLNVRSRSHILIHKGCFYKNTLGCILSGKGFIDMNADGYMDVTNTKDTLDLLLDLMPGEFEMNITQL